MISKDRLLTIPDLKLAGIIASMDDEQMRQFEQTLVFFVENFPDIEHKVKAALEAKDKEPLAAQLETLSAALEKIYAVDLASQVGEFIKILKNFDYENEKIEAFVSGFLGSAVMLSLDIQMAKYMDKNAQTKYMQKKMKSASVKNISEKSILAVDDAGIFLTMLKRNLQEWPFKLTCVNSGESALHYLKENDPDLFILDIEMPKMNGYELAAKIRERGHEAPIIFLTGNSAKDYVIKAVKAGASDFVVKPINKENLAEKINKHLYSKNA